MSPQLNPEMPTALITGGSRGIGREISATLAKDGFQIIITYVSRPEEAERTLDQVHEAGQNGAAFALDVAAHEAVEDFFATEIKDRINLAVLVNNAGITKDGLLLRMKDEAFERVLAVNLNGAFTCTREAARIMSKKRQGRIINIASVVGQMGNPGQSNYSAAKAGLIGLTKACAKELASRQITVNAVAPGLIETDMTRALDEKTREFYIESTPLKRFGTAMDVAGAVAFLASERASFITGQVLAVNGGLYM